MKRLVLMSALLAGVVMAASAAAETITVFAAASLKESLDAAIKVYAPASGDKLVVSYAASSALAKQIESGAPADVFISADLDWMDYLEQRKLIRPASRQNLLRNRLVLIAPAASKLTVAIAPGFPLAGMLGDGRLAMANPEAVPAGKYGKAALEFLGVWKSVGARVAGAENVRAALVLVSRGEAPLGIVYKTDAAAEPRVRIVGEFPENAHPPIIYPGAVTTSGKAGADSFLAWLGTPAARAIFGKYGF